jgi:hypothetical protein
MPCGERGAFRVRSSFLSLRFRGYNNEERSDVVTYLLVHLTPRPQSSFVTRYSPSLHGGRCHTRSYSRPSIKFPKPSLASIVPGCICVGSVEAWRWRGGSNDGAGNCVSLKYKFEGADGKYLVPTYHQMLAWLGPRRHNSRIIVTPPLCLAYGDMQLSQANRRDGSESIVDIKQGEVVFIAQSLDDRPPCT